jgi:tetratricopeptide (TPR) repeat protein
LRREALRRGRQTRPTGLDTLAAFKRLMELVTERRDYDEAQRLLEEELEIEKRVLGAGHQTTLATRQSLTRLIEQKASEAAIDSQRRQQLALAEERIRREGTNGGAWLQRALARADLRQWKLAREDFDQAIARNNLTNAGNTSYFADDCLELARRAFAARQHKTAEQASREAVRWFKQWEQEAPSLPEPSQGVGHSLWQLGDVLSATGRRQEAEQALEEAVRVFEQAAARRPEIPFLRQEQAFSHGKIGELCNSAGKSEDAERHFRSATELYGALSKEFPTNMWYPHEGIYTSWVLAEVLNKAGRWAAAEAAYGQSLSVHEQAAAAFPNEPEFKERLRSARLDVASFLEAQGKTAQADALRQRAQDGSSPPSPAK